MVVGATCILENTVGNGSWPSGWRENQTMTKENANKSRSQLTCPFCGSSNVRLKVRIIAILLVIAGGCYLVDSLVALSSSGDLREGWWHGITGFAVLALLAYCTWFGKTAKCRDCRKTFPSVAGLLGDDAPSEDN